MIKFTQNRNAVYMPHNNNDILGQMKLKEFTELGANVCSRESDKLTPNKIHVQC